MARRSSLISPARARAQADQRASSLLLPGNVPAATDDRAQFGDVVPRFRVGCVFHGGVTVAATYRFDRGGGTDRGPRVRLPARLVLRRPLDRLCKIRQRCHCIVDAGAAQQTVSPAHQRRRRGCRAALFAGWQPHRVRLHLVPRPLPHFRRTIRYRCVRRRATAHGRKPEFASTLLL